jgi:hypothetical protein
VSRVCARPGCAEAAVATLTYDYGARTGWLDRLTGEGHPMAYDLCGGHAGTLTVPRGWHLEDRRDAPRGGASAEGALAS